MTNTALTHQAVRHLSIDEAADGQRLDNFLINKLKGVPKSHIYRLIRSGQVRVNKGRAKQTQRLNSGDVVRIPPVRVAERAQAPDKTDYIPEFLYQDEFLWVINKPAGMAVHGGSGHQLGLIENLRVLFPNERQLELVHRLDRDTSGAILVARKRSTLKLLQRLLREGGIKRVYWLLANGFSKKQTSISAPLLRQEASTGKKMVVSKAGKAALTHFSLRASSAGFQLVEAELVTGRTHQIRVHSRFGGFPIVGDVRYGDAERDGLFFNEATHPPRLMLHARLLAFRHPVSGDAVKVVAPLDTRFSHLLKNLNINFK